MPWFFPHDLISTFHRCLAAFLYHDLQGAEKTPSSGNAGGLKKLDHVSGKAPGSEVQIGPIGFKRLGNSGQEKID